MRRIVAGIDDRLKVAVPVYGCGFLHEDSAGSPIREDGDRAEGPMGRTLRPLALPAGVRAPILFVNGTNDFAYPLDKLYRKWYQLP